ncbi:DNA-binding transcriptional regulator, LacI/PurR family [Streptomyces sp. 2131.1]|uniref:substrate-binding domain-containing protein n=1 Tax=Streptomyces sp. 2131.1 TaxID=1855346 RepID=UPI000894A1DF|nr:substrate-binding domain-containing protein [Streptomyces sp. 2131.1]SEC80609.1 DNA-binding transcriptional regulator, LacI/PurR family [Streptomyces sp. 2131.1]
MRESAAERHDRLLALVRERGSARVSDLAGLLGVSPVTVRRDVEALSERGLLDRVHGSVSWPRDAAAPAGADPAGGPVIGLIAPSATYYFAEVIRGAHEAAARAGARLVLRISDYRPEEDRARAEGLLASGADGLLIAPAWRGAEDQAAYGDWMAGLPVPTVLLERTPAPGSPLDGLDRVCSDHRHGVLLAVRHLVGLGHGTPLLVARADSPTALAVRSGYEDALAVLGHTGAPAMIGTSGPEVDPARFDAAVREVRDAVVSGRAASALVHNDVDAIHLVQRLSDLGVRVPEDLAVIAYDDEVAALGDIPLTAVSPPKRHIGRCATELLISRLGSGQDEDEPGRHLALLPRLRVRASTTR